jgi:hypothetical protein
MKRLLAVLTLCLLTALAATPACAKDKDSDALKKTIENRYWDIRMSIKSGDPDRFRANLAAGYANTDLAGAVRNADQIVDALGQTVPDDSRKEETTITSLERAGDGKVIVETNYDLTTMRALEDGSKIEYHMVTTSTDTWVKEGGAWLLEKSVANTGDVFINGEKIAHRVRGESLPAAAAKDKAAEKPAEKAADTAPAAQ